MCIQKPPDWSVSDRLSSEKLPSQISPTLQIITKDYSLK